MIQLYISMYDNGRKKRDKRDKRDMKEESTSEAHLNQCTKYIKYINILHVVRLDLGSQYLQRRKEQRALSAIQR